MYFTSWDANVFLCLLSVFPEEVVRGMIRMTKKIHEEYVREESLEYWLGLPDPGGNIVRVGKANRAWWKKRKNLKEFSELWRWRCPEKRRGDVIQWTRYNHGLNFYHEWMSTCVKAGEGTSKAGNWNSGDAWSYSIKDWELDTSEWEGYEEEVYFDMKERQRREYVGDWYANIHEGRYFLFFKENDMVSSAFVDTCRNSQNKHIETMSDIGDRWQTAQDLLTIDGGGIGEKPGNHIEHIDDLF